MNNKFAGNANSYHGFTFEETLSGVSRAGFKYIELAAVRGWTEHIHARMSDAELDRAKALIASHGLTSIALAGHANIMDEERLQDFMANIDLAAKMECPFVVTSTGEAHFGKEESLNDDILVQNISRLLPKLEQHHITMVIELHGLYHTGEAIARFLKRIPSPLLGINYDTANIVMYGGIDPMEDIKKCYQHVKYVHLKDKVGGKGVWNFPATGKGELPLKEFMGFMDSVGYGGPYSIEIEYTQDYCMREKDQPGDILVADREMQASFEYLKALGRV
ncbi:MAG TPA: sugar phosphate isomerase/epimerase family protein [Verrucomicrobiae bacterium]|nr:sugar phosphate isomerase/epimerase family protein [Verrucomicrobiae bacterium]